MKVSQAVALWRETNENADTPSDTQEYAQLWSEDECNGANVYDGWVNPSTVPKTDLNHQSQVGQRPDAVRW